jgi:hypothetical protein
MAERAGGAGPSPRRDPRARTRRELERFGRRDTRGFWRALALIGAVGWPIVGLAVGGALLGHAIDRRLGGGVWCTLAALALGTALGARTAWRSLRKDGA